MESLGFPVEDGYIQCGYYRREPAIEAMDRLLSLPQRPTAVFCTNDSMACGAMQLCIDRGMGIPDDISFVGVGNTEDGETMRPALTTVHVPRAEMGRLATMKLINMVRGQHQATLDTLLPVELLVRSSSGRAASRIAVA